MMPHEEVKFSLEESIKNSLRIDKDLKPECEELSFYRECYVFTPWTYSKEHKMQYIIEHRKFTNTLDLKILIEGNISEATEQMKEAYRDETVAKHYLMDSMEENISGAQLIGRQPSIIFNGASTRFNRPSTSSGYSTLWSMTVKIENQTGADIMTGILAYFINNFYQKKLEAETRHTKH